tara:strand:+ start:84 stop:437 length:354 start_codon:yes stop_codon:yes gene_type:complete
MSEENENVITGKIKLIGETKAGTSKAGKAWSKLSFLIANNSGYEGKEAIFSFDLFGEDKVEKFLKYNKVGSEVDVKYNIECREWEGKYFTNLAAWSVFKAEAEEAPADEALDEEPPF